MAYISYNELWENELDNIVFKGDKVQDMNINHLKLEVHDKFEKDEKLTTNFEAVDDEDLINKAYLDKHLSKKGLLSSLEKGYNEL